MKKIIHICPSSDTTITYGHCNLFWWNNKKMRQMGTKYQEMWRSFTIRGINCVQIPLLLWRCSVRRHFRPKEYFGQTFYLFYPIQVCFISPQFLYIYKTPEKCIPYIFMRKDLQNSCQWYSFEIKINFPSQNKIFHMEHFHSNLEAFGTIPLKFEKQKEVN